jgi:hypothetical protein
MVIKKVNNDNKKNGESILKGRVYVVTYQTLTDHEYNNIICTKDKVVIYGCVNLEYTDILE